MVPIGSDHGWEVAEGVHLLHDVAITHAGVRLSTLDDLENKRILAYSGAARFLGDEFRSVVEGNGNYREINNHRAQVRLLLQRVVDVVIADRLLVSWYLDYLRQEAEQVPQVVFHDIFAPVAHEVICRHSSVAAELSAGYDLVLKDGTLNAILTQYGVTEDDEIFLPPDYQSPKLNLTNPPLGKTISDE